MRDSAASGCNQSRKMGDTLVAALVAYGIGTKFDG
jgi:hypothetical protein